jgi:hypothetical protein
LFGSPHGYEYLGDGQWKNRKSKIYLEEVLTFGLLYEERLVLPKEVSYDHNQD